jgi:two-component system, LytTR family, response regulator
MFRTIIIEDEKESQATLTKMLKMYCPEIDLLGVFDSVSKSVGFIKENDIELIFLDIELPGESGFSIFEYFIQPRFKIIFTTAYNQYAVKAFKLSAVDYLLKPIDLSDLKNAIEKLKDLHNRQNMDEVYKMLIQNINHGSERIAIAHQNGYDLIELNEIIWLEAEINYTIIHLKSRAKITVAKTLRMFEDFLNPSQFFRVSRGAIVNIKYIIRFQKTNGLSITVIDDTVISLSETRKEEFLSLYKKI